MSHDDYTEGSDETAAVPEPVRVHLTGADIPLVPPRTSPQRRGLSTQTITLTIDNPIQQLLPLNTRRLHAWIRSETNPITIGGSKSDVQSGRGVAKLSASSFLPQPLPTTDEVWATAATLPTTVNVIAIIEGP